MSSLSPKLRACVSCRNPGDCLEVFAVHAGHSLQHIWQTAPGKGWSRWESLEETASSAPTLAVSPSRLDVFVVGVGQELRHRSQPAGQPWSGWSSRGEAPVYDPAAALNRDGRLEVLARRKGNQLWRTAEESVGGSWFPKWKPLRLGIRGKPAVPQNRDGRLELFARDPAKNNRLSNIWQLKAGKDWSKDWKPFGGETSDAACARNADGRLEVFVRGVLGELWHCRQSAPSNGWEQSRLLGGEITTPPAVGVNADGRLEVFARGTDKALWHIWQTKPGGGPTGKDWSSWRSLGGVINSEPSCARNLDGRLEVFARGSDNALWHIWQTEPGGGFLNLSWSEWESLGGKLIAH